MGEQFTFLAQPLKVSNIIADADLNLGAQKVIAAEVDTDTISEKTAGHNITAAKPITTSMGIITADNINVDTINEKTLNHGALLGVNKIGVLMAASATVQKTLANILRTNFTGSSTDVQVPDITYTIPSGVLPGSIVRIIQPLCTNGVGTAYGSVYVNGVSVDTKSTTSVWATMANLTHDVSVKSGDVITYFVRITSGGQVMVGAGTTLGGTPTLSNIMAAWP
ncbi:MAG: hypothetical protein PHW63_09305 [Alphaproteobacteria bacterium]|nr:hypothetical protein [Alphaproteobacteria bacterium]